MNHKVLELIPKLRQNIYFHMIGGGNRKGDRQYAFASEGWYDELNDETHEVNLEVCYEVTETEYDRYERVHNITLTIDDDLVDYVQYGIDESDFLNV
jgi:hypothetical protein